MFRSDCFNFDVFIYLSMFVCWQEIGDDHNNDDEIVELMGQPSNVFNKNKLSNVTFYLILPAV